MGDERMLAAAGSCGGPITARVPVVAVLAVAIGVFVFTAVSGMGVSRAQAQEEDSGGYEPLLSQDEVEESTESVTGYIADGRDESTTPVEGGGQMEDTAAEETSEEDTSAEDTSREDSGLSESPLQEEETDGGDETLPEASPGPPLAESTAAEETFEQSATTPTMESTAPTLGEYTEETTSTPAATPESGGVAPTALIVPLLALGSGLIISAFAVRRRGSWAGTSAEEDGA